MPEFSQLLGVALVVYALTPAAVAGLAAWAYRGADR